VTAAHSRDTDLSFRQGPLFEQGEGRWLCLQVNILLLSLPLDASEGLFAVLSVDFTLFFILFVSISAYPGMIRLHICSYYLIYFIVNGFKQ
jgi:hypothetical protein